MTRRRILLGLAVLMVLAVAGAGAWLWFTEERAPARSPALLCDRLSEASGLDDAIVTGDPTRLGPLVSALERATQGAPPEIAAQLDVLTTFVVEVTDEVRAEPTDKRRALVDALAARQDRIDAVSSAGAAVEEWTRVNCATSLRPTTTRR